MTRIPLSIRRSIPVLIFGLSLTCVSGIASAQTPVLVGLFEGHGISPPANAKRAKQARAAAQQLRRNCGFLDWVNGGGVRFSYYTCSDTAGVLAKLGPDGAAAILDQLDHPQADRRMGFYPPPFEALLQALGRTERPDLVPIIITAMKRLVARRKLSDPRVRDFGRDKWRQFLHALEAITYTSIDRKGGWRMSSTANDDTALDPIIPMWEKWYQRHGSEPQKKWRQRAVAQGRTILAKGKLEDVLWAAKKLAHFAETHAEAKAALRSHYQKRNCRRQKVKVPGRGYYHFHENWECETLYNTTERLKKIRPRRVPSTR